MKFAPTAIALAFLAALALDPTYNHSQSVIGDQFLTAFTFEAITDPSAGRV